MPIKAIIIEYCLFTTTRYVATTAKNSKELLIINYNNVTMCVNMIPILLVLSTLPVISTERQSLYEVFKTNSLIN